MTKTMKAVLVLFIVYSVVSTAINWKTMEKNAGLESELATVKENLSEKEGKLTALTDQLDAAIREKGISDTQTDKELASLDEMKIELEKTKGDLDALKEKFGYDPAIEWSLSRLGLTTDQVESSLKGNPEVIGQEPVLGGAMGFNRVFMLTPNWVFGQFEDGHILGWGIYEFKYSKGVFTWREIASILDGDIDFGK